MVSRSEASRLNPFVLCFLPFVSMYKDPILRLLVCKLAAIEMLSDGTLESMSNVLVEGSLFHDFIRSAILQWGRNLARQPPRGYILYDKL